MEQLVPLLNDLAAQLETTVEFLWEVLIRQARVYAISYIIASIAFVVVGIGNYKFLANLLNEIEDKNDDLVGMQVPRLIISIVIWGILLFALLGFLVNFSNFLTALFNPEYWALQKILEAIK